MALGYWSLLDTLQAEQDKASRDHQIRSLNEEIQNQDDVIARMTKEKKVMQDRITTSLEDVQVKLVVKCLFLYFSVLLLVLRWEKDLTKRLLSST